MALYVYLRDSILILGPQPGGEGEEWMETRLSNFAGFKEGHITDPEMKAVGTSGALQGMGRQNWWWGPRTGEGSKKE